MGSMKAVGAVAATGVVSVLLLKLLAAVAAPLLGMVFGLLTKALIIGLVVAAAFFLYRVFRRRRDAAA